MSSFLGFASTFLPVLLLVCPVTHVLADGVLYSAIRNDTGTYNDGAYGTKPNQTYYSSPLRSPLFLVNAWNEAAMSNATHILISPTVAKQHRSPMVFSAKDLSLVYADPVRGGSNPQLQSFNGTQYFTFWTGADMRGWGTGGGVLMDDSFEIVYNITTKGLTTGADNHEFQLTHDGGAMLNNYHTVTYDVTAVGGPPDGRLQDCAFQEVDIETGDVRFEWHATDHFDLTESFGDDYKDKPNGWDWFHMNSQLKTRDGHYLISSRHLRMIALINGTDGERIWQLGGKLNSFKDLSNGKATNFAYQHHARLVDDSFTVGDPFTEVTFYDNHVMHASSPTPGCTDNCSRGMRVRLDLEAMTAEVVLELFHPKGVQAWAQGGYQSLPEGGALVSWGTVPAVTEFSADGEVVMDLQLGPWTGAREGVISSYRVYKSNWVAQPPWGPEIAVVDSAIYASWNGATEYVAWSIVSSPPSPFFVSWTCDS